MGSGGVFGLDSPRSRSLLSGVVLEKSKMRPLTVLNVTWPIYVVERQSVTPGSEIFSLSSFVFRGCAGDKVASMNANCWRADRHSLAQHSVPAGAQKNNCLSYRSFSALFVSLRFNGARFNHMVAVR